MAALNFVRNSICFSEVCVIILPTNILRVLTLALINAHTISFVICPNIGIYYFPFINYTESENRYFQRHTKPFGVIHDNI